MTKLSNSSLKNFPMKAPEKLSKLLLQPWIIYERLFCLWWIKAWIEKAHNWIKQGESFSKSENAFQLIFEQLQWTTKSIARFDWRSSKA